MKVYLVKSEIVLYSLSCFQTKVMDSYHGPAKHDYFDLEKSVIEVIVTKKEPKENESIRAWDKKVQN